jgi:5'-AMP-activated protein kinase, regulatory gamma subunit
LWLFINSDALLFFFRSQDQSTTDGSNSTAVRPASAPADAKARNKNKEKEAKRQERELEKREKEQRRVEKEQAKKLEKEAAKLEKLNRHDKISRSSERVNARSGSLERRRSGDDSGVRNQFTVHGIYYFPSYKIILLNTYSVFFY